MYFSSYSATRAAFLKPSYCVLPVCHYILQLVFLFVVNNFIATSDIALQIASEWGGGYWNFIYIIDHGSQA